LLLISCLRTWLSRDDAPGWYRADADPVVGAALRLIHHDPARAWTVDALAREVGLSRAAFSRLFTALVDESPMAYLTGWRLDLAADLLLQPDATLASVVRAVGYATPFALSAAFKRGRGGSRAAHRARAGAACARSALDGDELDVPERAVVRDGGEERADRLAATVRGRAGVEQSQPA